MNVVRLVRLYNMTFPGLHSTADNRPITQAPSSFLECWTGKELDGGSSHDSLPLGILCELALDELVSSYDKNDCARRPFVVLRTRSSFIQRKDTTIGR
jgi:hypothetical protein